MSLQTPTRIDSSKIASEAIRKIDSTLEIDKARISCMRENEVHPKSKSYMVRIPSKQYSKSAPNDRDIDSIRVSRELSLFQKRERFDVKNQSSIIDMTRAHQSAKHKPLNQASTPINLSRRMNVQEEVVRGHLGMANSAQHLRSAEGQRTATQRSGFINEPPSQKALTRHRSRLSLSVDPEDIEELSNSSITKHSKVRTRSRSERGVSEAYLKWQSKQCDAVEGLAFKLLATKNVRSVVTKLEDNSHISPNKRNMTCTMSRGINKEDKGERLDTEDVKLSTNFVREKYFYVRSDSPES